MACTYSNNSERSSTLINRTDGSGKGLTVLTCHRLPWCLLLRQTMLISQGRHQQEPALQPGRPANHTNTPASIAGQTIGSTDCWNNISKAHPSEQAETPPFLTTTNAEMLFHYTSCISMKEGQCTVNLIPEKNIELQQALRVSTKP